MAVLRQDPEWCRRVDGELHPRCRRDWAAVDGEWATRIREAAPRLRASSASGGRPRQVNVNVVRAALGLNAGIYERWLSLPLTWAAMDDAVEDDDAFVARLVLWAVKRIEAAAGEVDEASVAALARAGRGRDLCTQDRVRAAFVHAMRSRQRAPLRGP